MGDNSTLNFPLEIKSVRANGYFAGYASIYDFQDYHDDIITKGAFRESILSNDNDVKLLWQHDPELPIGNFSSIFEDDNGLYVEGQINLQTSQGQEAYSLLKTKAISSLSVGFTVTDFELEDEIRIITKAELWEISLVTFPANKHAKIKVVKSLSEEQHMEKQLIEAIEKNILTLKIN